MEVDNKNGSIVKDESGFYVISAVKTASRKPKHLTKRLGKTKGKPSSKNAVAKNRETFLLNRQAKLKERDDHVQKVVASQRMRVKGESSTTALRISDGIKVSVSFFNMKRPQRKID